MYDALHIGILKKFEDDDEKHESENLDTTVEDDKAQKITLTEWDENITSVISMVLGKGSRSKAFDLIKLLISEKHITFNENYTITRLKTDMDIPIEEFLRYIFVMNANIKKI